MAKNQYLDKSEQDLLKLNSPIYSEDQLKILNRKTPKEHIELKTDRHGQKYKSVSAPYMKKQALLIFGGNMNFEVKHHEITVSREAVVLGRLTVYFNGKVFYREQFGQFYLGRETKQLGGKTVTYTSDIGNGLKAAATDSLKKCLAEFGIAWDIYGNQENDEPEPEEKIDYKLQKKIDRFEHFAEQAKTEEDLKNNYNKIFGEDEVKEALDIFKVNIKRIMSK